MKKTTAALIVFCTLLLASCSYQEVSYGGVKNVQLQGASLSEIKLKITVNVKNPNTYKITLTGGKFNVKSEDYDLGTFKLTEKTVIPAQSEGDVEIYVGTKIKSLFSSASLALMANIQKNSFPVTIEGYIIAKAYLFRKKVKFNKTEQVSL